MNNRALDMARDAHIEMTSILERLEDVRRQFCWSSMPSEFTDSVADMTDDAETALMALEHVIAEQESVMS